MTSALTARNAYSSTTRNTGTPRAIEYKVFSQVTAALVRANDNKRDDYPAYIDALSRNLRLWTAFGADAANDANPLPDALRGQIFYLFEFIYQHTQKILRGDTSLSVDPLVNINNTIMPGLRSNIDAEAVS